MTYKVQIDDLVRDATPEEAAEFDALKQQPTLADLMQAQMAAKESAKTKLKALGLTDAEIAALVG